MDYIKLLERTKSFINRVYDNPWTSVSQTLFIIVLLFICTLSSCSRTIKNNAYVLRYESMKTSYEQTWQAYSACSVWRDNAMILCRDLTYECNRLRQVNETLSIEVANLKFELQRRKK